MFRLPRATTNSWAIGGLMLTAAGLLAPLHAVAEDPLFTLMDSDLSAKDSTPDRAICERAVYSKSFDRWIKACSEGRSGDATLEWTKVLAEAKGAQNLFELASLTTGRLEFLEGEQSQLIEKTGGITAILIVILGNTQHQLGACNQTASIADYISYRYRKSSRYKDSIIYAQKALDIRRKALPPGNRLIFDSLLTLGEVQLLDEDCTAAKINADSALAIATKAHSGAAKYLARVLLVKISRANRH